MAGPSYAVVYVDDDGPVGGNHFQDLAAALAATEPDGAIYIAAGEYYLSSPLSPGHDVAFIGEGPNDVYIYGIGLSSVFDISGVSVHIYGCTITGAQTGVTIQWTDTNLYRAYLHNNFITNNNASLSGVSVFVENAEANVDIVDNTIAFNNGPGVSMNLVNAEVYCTISDNRIYSNDHGGIYVTTEESYIEHSILRNEIHDNAEAIYNTGVKYVLHGIYDGFVSFEDNWIYDNYGAGISFNYYVPVQVDTVDGGVPVLTSELEISGNVIEGNDGNGIEMVSYLQIAQPLDGITTYSAEIWTEAYVSRNDIRENGGTGIWCGVSFARAESTLGSNMHIIAFYAIFVEKNMVCGNDSGGVYCHAPFNFGMYNNLIAGNTGEAYGVEIDVGYANLYNNTIIDNSAGLAMNYGLYTINNIITSNNGPGVYILTDELPCANSNGSCFICNDVWGNGCCPADDYVNMQDMTGLYGNISKDPEFVGPYDAHLATGSPCINTGWDDVFPLLQDDLEDTPRPLGFAYDMGCYEALSQNWAPHLTQPLASHNLAHANAFWSCLKENLPDEMTGDETALVEEIQGIMTQAVLLGNPIMTNGLMQQAQALMQQLEALLQCGCS